MTPYDTVANVDAYAITKMHTASYDRASADVKTRATYEASRIIDALNYHGYKTDPDQEHEFPRWGDTTVRDDILNAFYEIVIALVSGINPAEEYENLTRKSTVFVSVRSTYDRTIVPEHTIAGVPSIAAWRLLKPYLRADQEVKVCRV